MESMETCLYFVVLRFVVRRTVTAWMKCGQFFRGSVTNNFHMDRVWIKDSFYPQYGKLCEINAKMPVKTGL